jgi:hypothetical protein
MLHYLVHRCDASASCNHAYVLLHIGLKLQLFVQRKINRGSASRASQHSNLSVLLSDTGVRIAAAVLIEHYIAVIICCSSGVHCSTSMLMSENTLSLGYVSLNTCYRHAPIHTACSTAPLRHIAAE